VHVTKEDIAECESDIDDDPRRSKHDTNYCYVLFGIFSDGDEDYGEIVYDFVAYKDMMELKDNVPVFSNVGEK
jgi:hypothetical protein